MGLLLIIFKSLGAFVEKDPGKFISNTQKNKIFKKDQLYKDVLYKDKTLRQEISPGQCGSVGWIILRYT